MSRPDSERALAIYKTFTRQTEEVVGFLGVARHFQSATRLEIPKLKHASTDLTRLLEDDLNDPDFDLRRREYMAAKGIKKDVNAPAERSSNFGASQPTAASNVPNFNSNPPKQAEQPKAPAPDLIDFFDSIETNQQQTTPQAPAQYQQTGFQQPQQTGFQQQQQPFYAQQTGFPQQQQPQMTGYGQQNPYGIQQQTTGNPFGQPQAQTQAQPLQAQPTGAGFGGYGPQPHSFAYQPQLGSIPQNGMATYQQQQQPMQAQQQPSPSTPTNPFRQSMMVNQPTGGAAAGAPITPLQRQNTNPFAKRLSMAAPQGNYGAPEQVPQVPQMPQVPQIPQSQSPQPLQPQRTGTNPFARNSPAPQNTGLQPLQPNPTGSTNPFRQSQFINQQTGQGWQSSGQHGTMGGLEQLETVPIFPRPGMT